MAHHAVASRPELLETVSSIQISEQSRLPDASLVSRFVLRGLLGHIGPASTPSAGCTARPWKQKSGDPCPKDFSAKGLRGHVRVQKDKFKQIGRESVYLNSGFRREKKILGLGIDTRKQKEEKAGFRQGCTMLKPQG